MNQDAGFSIHPAIFSRSQMSVAINALDRAAIPRTKAGARHVLAVPEVRSIASAESLLEIARGYVGSGAFPFRATLFDKSLSANWLVAWHQDTALPILHRREVAGWGPWTEKGGVLHAMAPASALEGMIALRVHIDDSTLDNGPLRVLPGTHLGGVLCDADVDRLASMSVSVDCVVDAGGVIAMRPLILHASSKARSDRPRRVLHIEYAGPQHLPGGLELAVG
jgi:ectoine hydroxylase-related dioxygenase (phytanoyl-CoA dioxygenase family)